MNFFRSKIFIGSFIAFFITVNVSYAFVPLLIALETMASRAAVLSFFASGVATVAANDDVTVKSSGTRRMTIKRGLNAALGFASIAQLMGYSSSTVTVYNYIGSYQQTVSSESLSAAIAVQEAYIIGRGWTLLGSWSSLTNGIIESHRSFRAGSSTFVTSIYNHGSSSILMTDSSKLITDLRNNPSQLLTDNLVSSASNLAISNPSQYDSTVTIEDSAAYQLPSDYFSGDSLAVDNFGSLTLNGVPLNGNVGTFTGQDGLTHHMTIGANGSLLVDGQLSTGFTASNISSGTSTTTNSNGTTSTTTSSVNNSGIIAANRAVSDSVNRASSANTSALSDLKAAVDNSAIGFGTPTPNQSMSTNQSVDFSTFTLNPISITNASGVCPAPQTLTIHGQAMIIDNSPICTFFDWIRPAVLAIGWFTAIGVFVSGIRGN